MENKEINVTPEKKKWPWWKKLVTIFGSTIGGIVALVLCFVLVLNVGKFGIYHNYYSIRSVICTNHGLSDNFHSQGTAVTNDGKYVLTSGYMSDKTNSRIYITDTETDTTQYVKLTKNGKDNKYHCGGVAISGDTVYVVSNDTIFPLSFSEMLSVGNGGLIDLGTG